MRVVFFYHFLFLVHYNIKAGSQDKKLFKKKKTQSFGNRQLNMVDGADQGMV